MIQRSEIVVMLAEEEIKENLVGEPGATGGSRKKNAESNYPQ